MVLGLAAVEKAFRLYLDPAAKEDDKIVVDASVDAFLQEHLEGIDLYRKEGLVQKIYDRDTPGLVSWGGVREDELYDDLTILAIRRK